MTAPTKITEAWARRWGAQLRRQNTATAQEVDRLWRILDPENQGPGCTMPYPPDAGWHTALAQTCSDALTRVEVLAAFLRRVKEDIGPPFEEGGLKWHEGKHGWLAHDGYPRHQHSINGQLTISPHSTQLHFKGGLPFEEKV